MSALGIERMVRQFPSDLLFPQIVIPFRFSVSEQLGLVASLGWDKLSRISQRGEYIFPILGYVSYVLSTETLRTAPSELRIIKAASVLQNLAWYPGSHLGGVVTCAGRLLDGFALGRIPLLAGEFGAGALKNTAHHKGPHVNAAVEHALRHGYSGSKNSDRINGDCVRTVLYTARHSGNLLASLEGVNEFLDRAVTDENPVNADHAREARSMIFSSSL